MRRKIEDLERQPKPKDQMPETPRAEAWSSEQKDGTENENHREGSKTAWNPYASRANEITVQAY